MYLNTPSTLPKPRNPFVALARRRHGGSHRPTVGTVRRLAARSLRRELDTMKSLIP